MTSSSLSSPSGPALARRALISASEPSRLSGRIASLRRGSRMIFADLHHLGELYQIACPAASTAPFELLSGCQLGDWVEIDGSWRSTLSGDRALFCDRARRLAEASAGFPSWGEPLSESSARLHPDLARASDPHRMRRIHRRFLMIDRMRRWARDELHLLETITPMLSSEASGAQATPFMTRLESIDRDLALRVAPENHLARLLCSGIPALYEIGSSFRNEGFSRRHHPEFLMMEAYHVDWSWRDALRLAQQGCQMALSELAPDRRAFPPEWIEMDVFEALPRFGFQGPVSLDSLGDFLLGSGQTPSEDLELRAWQALERLDSPDGFLALTGHPAALSPLAAMDPQQPSRAARFELFIGGIEVANGYAQNTDAALQRQRFADQAQLHQLGLEAMGSDEAYLSAMESLGMPAFSGFGIGLDRLCMLAFDCSIREALPFPLSGS